LKIGQYLAKIWTKGKGGGLVFLPMLYNGVSIIYQYATTLLNVFHRCLDGFIANSRSHNRRLAYFMQQQHVGSIKVMRRRLWRDGRDEGGR